MKTDGDKLDTWKTKVNLRVENEQVELGKQKG